MQKFLFVLLCTIGSQILVAQTSVKPSLIADTTHITGEETPSSLLIKNKPDILENIHMNFLLRSSLEIPDGETQSRIKMNEARFEVLGTIVPDLDFRVRWRINQSHNPKSQDNSPGSLDIASVNYKFGKDKKWSINAGKQAAYVGSWEFENNPTFEYQYSEFINYQTNIFLMALKLGYQVNKNHSFHLQLHNTYNETFYTTYGNTGYDFTGVKPAKTPMGLYVSWLGKMFDQKYHTFWSYNVSQFASGKTNHSFALGNKLVLDKFKAYLDLQYSGLGMDYPNIASPAINAHRLNANPGASRVFADNINYKSAILRMDYEFVPRWFVTAKGYYEAASQTGNNNVGNNFRENIGFLAGLEFQPISSQQMKMFAYYYNNQVKYNNTVSAANTGQNLNLFSVGVLYFVNVF